MPVIKVRENEPFDVALRKKAAAVKRAAKKVSRENARHVRMY